MKLLHVFLVVVAIAFTIQSCKDDQNTELSSDTSIDIFSKTDEVWTFIYDGRPFQSQDRARCTYIFEAVGDTVADVVIKGDIEIEARLHLKVLRYYRSRNYFGKDDVITSSDEHTLYCFYDHFTNSLIGLSGSLKKAKPFTFCDYDLKVNDTLCNNLTIVGEDILWIGKRPHRRFLTSNGGDIIEGISLNNFCESGLPMIYPGEYEPLEITYKNSELSYDLLNGKEQ